MDGPIIGKPIEGDDARRDCIHVAVAPVVAACRLRPGQHVVFCRDGDTSRVEGIDFVGNLGIVDPFLMADVEPGQRFYLFLLPGTVTSLRHVWVHPAFRPVTKGASHDQ